MVFKNTTQDIFPVIKDNRVFCTLKPAYEQLKGTNLSPTDISFSLM